MKKIILLITILPLLLSFTFWHCSEAPTEITEDKTAVRQLTAAESKIIEADNRFGLKIFRELNKKALDTNIFISPLSISMALGMTLNGANGTTYDSMKHTLELTGLTEQEINESYRSLMDYLPRLDPKVKFQIANSIWYRLNFLVEKEFIDKNIKYFDSEVKSLNFSDPDAGNIINGWVKDKTYGKIEKIVPVPIPPTVVMYLINAIYFKGLWTYQFDKNNTRDSYFYLANGGRIACKLMYNKGMFKCLQNELFQAIDLPYGDSLFSMTIFLPKQGTDVNNLLAQFNEANWLAWSNSFAREEAEIYFPKFKLEYEKSLIEVLKILGMGIAFSGRADFSRIEKRGGLFISEVMHKTFVEVDEEGTEAAAVTMVEISRISAPQIFSMRVDRPFIFVIRENHSGTILFIGKVMRV